MSDDDELLFRCISAPGLEEDDLYAAMEPEGGRRGLWSDRLRRPARLGDSHERTDAQWRRDRHRELLDKWEPVSNRSPAKKDSPRRRQSG